MTAEWPKAPLLDIVRCVCMSEYIYVYVYVYSNVRVDMGSGPAAALEKLYSIIVNYSVL